MSWHSVGKGSATEYFNRINKGLSNLKDKSQSDSLSQRVNQPGYLPNRVPWIFSTTEWLEQGWGIHWWSNPSDISWNIRLRQSTSKNANSTVTHVWANNNRGTHFDEFVLNFNLQSGNLIPYNRNDPANDGGSQNIIAPGLINFYDFLKLLDAPKLTANGRTNHVVIKYNSTIFPSLTLIGQFEPEGTKFNDSASDPTNISSWSCSFIVNDSNPRLSDNTRNTSNTDLLNAALNNIYYGKGGSYKQYDYFAESSYSGGFNRDIEGFNNIDTPPPYEPPKLQQISGIGLNPFTNLKK